MNCSDNTQQQQALRLIAETNSSFFLTGRAGTGKTTFLRNVQNEVKKNFIVLAPTGVAAIQAGGQTLHSFFGLPFEALTPKNVCKVNREKCDIIAHVDTIIIDEVSMVRCDIVDAIDRQLRKSCKNALPFGGKQVVFVGDMQQLPPVVTRDADREVFREHYNTERPYFFKAKVLQHMRLPAIEFVKVYRQDEAEFLSVLNHIRDGIADTNDLRTLNCRVDEGAAERDCPVILTPYNKRVDAINSRKLAEIKKPAHIFEATLTGSFKPDKAPVEPRITLKEGAQVMLCRNDKALRWANGTIATINSIDGDTVTVKLANGDCHKIEPATWEECEYTYNKESDTIEKKPIGQFTQLPLRLAWAVTIHRSQGMTFDRMHLDASQGIRETGQLYVALSRVRTLQGLTLQCPITPWMVSCDAEVRQFATTYNNKEIITAETSLGAALRPSLVKDDFDGAAATALRLAREATKHGDLHEAAYILGKMYDLLISDEHLLNSAPNFAPAPEDGICAQFTNAALALYAGHYADGVAWADKVLAQRECPHARFIRTRCLMLQEHYKEADEEGDRLVQAKGGHADDKTYFIAAEINAHVGGGTLPFLQYVVSAHRKYLPAIVRMRQMMRTAKMTLQDAGPLTEAFNNKAVGDADFRQSIQNTQQPEALSQLTAALLNIAS